jgi:hypothetical protein
MVDVDCAVGDPPCLTAADDSGYEIDEAEVIYWGRCPECVAAAAESSGAPHLAAVRNEQSRDATSAKAGHDHQSETVSE